MARDFANDLFGVVTFVRQKQAVRKPGFSGVVQQPCQFHQLGFTLA